MSYQVIARKWRPQTFEEVTGQEPITRTLTNAIEHERLHHAYLFSGARGVGKTTTARLLAKALNCHKSDKPTTTPCAVTDSDSCASCREVAEGRSIDVLEIDAASNTGVDNVRDSIITTVGISPARDRYKVFIIDEVHMLSTQAFNALLKTLEEPPPRVAFVMATTEAHKLPDTILSRCQQFEFRTIPVPKITDRLRRIADAEKINITQDALREIARAGEGSMRDAQSAFDQVISFSGEQIEAADVETALGLAGTELLRRTMRAVAEAQPAEAIRVVDDLVMRGHDLRNFTRDLLAYTRDLLLARINGDGNSAAASDAYDATSDAETVALAARFSESDLVRFFHSLTATERDLRESAHPRYQLEVGLVKLIEMGKLAQLDDVLRRLTQLETDLRSTSLRGNAPPAASGGGGSVPPATGGARRPATGGGIGSPRPTFTASPDPSATSALPVASTPPAPLASISEMSAPQIANHAEDVDEAATAQNSALKLVAPSAANASVVQKRSDRHTGFQSNADAPPFALHTTQAPAQVVLEKAEPFVSAEAIAASPIEKIKVELERRNRAFVAVALDQAERVAFDGDDLCIEFTPKTKHLRDNLTRSDNIKILREVCREVTGRDTGLRINVRDPNEIVEETGQPTKESLLKKQADEERAELWRYAEAHPTIQSFKRIFRGEIVDVWRDPAAAATPLPPTPDAKS
jgi:DNA polymerase-3 subunit gamma/tau